MPYRYGGIVLECGVICDGRTGPIMQIIREFDSYDAQPSDGSQKEYVVGRESQLMVGHTLTG